jgi:lipopolysaccharide/colanic/teichoic acid biosynthesis glycosyltransferase
MGAGDQVINITRTKPLSWSSRQMNRINDIVKRFFDIVVSIFVLTFFAPFFIIIALIIKRGSTGPIFYRGRRTGRFGKPFNILKFRTMEETPQSYLGPRITGRDDSRITPIGHWLRDTKLNEFPQFWNVLKGDMSLVGPRPEDDELSKTWPRSVWDEVLSVRPGITSPASVQYHDEEKLLSGCDVEQTYLTELSPNKMRLDQLYVRYHSFLLDLDVLLWTAMILLPRVGDYKLPEELLFVGLISRFIRRFLNWFTIDLITAFIAFSITGLIFRANAPLNVGWFTAVIQAFGYSVLFSLMGVLFGTNRIRWSKAAPADYFDLVPSWILATVIAFFVNLFLGYLPADLILIASVLSLFGFVAVRARKMIITHFLQRSPVFQKRNRMVRERVLIIGLGASAQHTAWLFEHLMNSRLYSVVGFVDNDLLSRGLRYYGTNVIGSWEDIPNLVDKHDVGLIILADYRVDKDGLRLIRKISSTTSAKLVVMPDILASVNQLIKRPSTNSNVGQSGDDQSDSKCIDCLANHISSQKM